MPRALSQFLQNPKGNKDVVIVLLGWAGATNRLLDKYVQIYQLKGYDTIRFTANLSDKAWGHLKYTREVSSLAEDVTRALNDKEIAIHCFSMNGVFSLCSLQLQFPHLNLMKNTRGILFDSAPVQFNTTAITTYLKVMDYSNAERMKNFGCTESIRYKLSKAQQFLAASKYFAVLELRNLFGWDRSNFSAYEFFLSFPDTPHILFFVYSDADDVCSAKTIESFALQQRKRGRVVEELHLKDSEHVQHFRRYPEQYSQLIDNFLRKIQYPSKL